MAQLRTEPGLADGDAVYAALVQMTDGLDEAAALRVMARLVLLLANHAGDDAAVLEAIRLARADAR